VRVTLVGTRGGVASSRSGAVLAHEEQAMTAAAPGFAHLHRQLPQQDGGDGYQPQLLPFHSTIK